MIEQDHAIGYVLLQTMSRKRPARAGFGGDHGGDALLLEPPKQPAQFGTNDGFIWKSSKEHLNGVENQALGADTSNSVFYAHKKTGEVVFSGFFKLVARNLYVVNDQHIFLFQRHEVIAQ